MIATGSLKLRRNGAGDFDARILLKMSLGLQQWAFLKEFEIPMFDRSKQSRRKELALRRFYSAQTEKTTFFGDGVRQDGEVVFENVPNVGGLHIFDSLLENGFGIIDYGWFAKDGNTNRRIVEVEFLPGENQVNDEGLEDLRGLFGDRGCNLWGHDNRMVMDTHEDRLSSTISLSLNHGKPVVAERHLEMEPTDEGFVIDVR